MWRHLSATSGVSRPLSKTSQQTARLSGCVARGRCHTPFCEKRAKVAPSSGTQLGSMAESWAWRRMTSECKIEFIKVGRFIRIRKSVIDAYLNENTVKPH